MSDDLAEFAVYADNDGAMTLDHIRDTTPHCCWSVEIHNGTTLPELGELAAAHLAEAHASGSRSSPSCSTSSVT